jgi:hypothetical protein
MLPFTCPTCGRDRCTLVFSHPFNPKNPGAVLGFMHPGADGKNDPTGFVTCGLTADVDKVQRIDDALCRNVSAVSLDLIGVVRGKKI